MLQVMLAWRPTDQGTLSERYHSAIDVNTTRGVVVGRPTIILARRLSRLTRSVLFLTNETTILIVHPVSASSLQFN